MEKKSNHHSLDYLSEYFIYIYIFLFFFFVVNNNSAKQHDAISRLDLVFSLVCERTYSFYSSQMEYFS